jgi:hypothetical protein
LQFSLELATREKELRDFDKSRWARTTIQKFHLTHAENFGRLKEFAAFEHLVKF